MKGVRLHHCSRSDTMSLLKSTNAMNRHLILQAASALCDSAINPYWYPVTCSACRKGRLRVTEGRDLLRNMYWQATGDSVIGLVTLTQHRSHGKNSLNCSAHWREEYTSLQSPRKQHVYRGWRSAPDQYRARHHLQAQYPSLLSSNVSHLNWLSQDKNIESLWTSSRHHLM